MIFASRPPFEYKNMFNKELSIKTYGYNSLIEFVFDPPHSILVKRPHPKEKQPFFPVPISLGHSRPTYDVDRPAAIS